MKTVSGRPTRQASEMLVQHMLTSAAQSFLEKGFQGASIEGIAKMAAVSKLTIYRHFSSKSSLFLAVIHTYVESYVSGLNQTTNTGKPPEQALTDIGNYIATHWFHSDNMKFSRIVIAEMHRIEGLAELIDQLMNESRAPVERYLAQLQAQGRVRFGDVRAATIQFVQLCVLGHYYLLRDESVMPDAETRARLVQSGVDLFLHGYLLPTDAG